MKYLIPLVLVCALLCGCAQAKPSDETIPLPTESVAGEATETEDPGGTVRTVPLNLSAVQGLFVFQDQLLLLSGEETAVLTLLDPVTLEEGGRRDLGFRPADPSPSFHSDGTISLFDPESAETVVLDKELKELRRIAVPGAISGSPILSGNGKTLFYCTASHLRALDLESGIHRCVKEMSFERQTLTRLHMDGTVLQCRVLRDGQEETLFLSAKDGTLLHCQEGNTELMTAGDSYFARIDAGGYRLSVFGTDPDAPKLLLPADLNGQTFFLPSRMETLNAAVTEDGRVQLELCSLSSGQILSRLTLDPLCAPTAAVNLSDGTLALLIYNAQTERSSLLLWEPRRDTSPSGCQIVPYPTSEHPDTAALAQCRQQARELGDRYGIQILIGMEAAEAAPKKLQPEPERLTPLLQRELALLEQRLAAFPEALLRKTSVHFSGVKLCLVRSLSGAAGAACQLLDSKEAYLVIPTGSDGKPALYHQLYHLMEIHIFSESNALDQWNALNPAGFQYDYDYIANAQRDSGVYLFEENRAFVDTFSMSYPTEDRARIFESAMLPENHWLFHPKAMQKKLHTLCTAIREAYSLVDAEETFLWEQYLE